MNSRDKIIELGNVPVHKTLIRKVPVINEGRAPVDLRFDLMNNLLHDKKYIEKAPTCIPKSNENITQHQESIIKAKRSDENDINLQRNMTYAARALIIEPSELTRVRTNEKIDLTIKFKATSRINMFTQKVGAIVDSTIFSLFILRGSCVGPEFRLDKSYIAFGTIIQGCISETKLVLMNIGDVGGK